MVAKEKVMGKENQGCYSDSCDNFVDKQQLFGSSGIHQKNIRCTS